MPSTETVKKSPRKARPRVKKISTKQAEEEKEAAIEAALKTAQAKWEEDKEIEESQHDFGYDEDPDIEATGNGEYHETANFGEEPEGSFDLFVYVQQNFEDQGTPVTYYIKKDNEVLPSISGPCSWDMLQKKYGGGTYKVEARHAINRQYIKASTQRLADIPDSSRNEEPVIVAAPAPTPGPDMNKMFEGMSHIFLQMQEMVAKKESREERDTAKSSDSFNNTFLTLLTQQQSQSTETMMKIAEMSNSNAKSQSETFAKVLEKMDDKFTRMFEKLADNKNDKDAIGTLELIKIMNESRSEGMGTMETIMELAQGFAENQAPTDSKETMLSSLVKGMLPILSGAGKSIETANAQRGSLPQGSPGGRPAVRAQAPGGHAAPRPGAQTVRPPHQQNFSSGPGGGGQVSAARALGLPTFTDSNNISGQAGTISETPASSIHSAPSGEPITQAGAGVMKRNANTVFVPQAGEVITPVVVEKPAVDRDSNDLYNNSSITQQTIAELAIPSIAAHIFTDSITPTESAKLILAELWGQGFNAETVNKEFTFDFMLQIAGSFGIGEDKRAWFEEFYAVIQDAAGTRDSGGPEPTAV